MTAYYNEIEPYAAQWLRNLIKAGHIPHGEVDTRSIVDVSLDDLRGYTQCHFFAGIGGWGLALRLAGWPDNRPIWTGSCPCQPFSVAGKRAGVDDPRHLWPHFHRLIRAVRPPVVMGEQVAGAAGYGWLDGVRADLARENYASRGVDIPACAVDAPHIRQRLYWVASDMGNANNTRPQGHGEPVHEHDPKGRQEQIGRPPKTGVDDMANSGCKQRSERCKSKSLTKNRTDRGEENIYDQRCSDGDMEDANGIGWEHGEYAQNGRKAGTVNQSSGGDCSFWSDHIWLTGADGKSRRSKPSIPLLANGIPNRVGRLRAYGNAIVPQVAAEVIKAYIYAEEGEGLT